MKRRVHMIERFMSKVELDPETGCALWTARIEPHGYGKFSCKEDGRWTRRYAHRIAYEVFVGPIPDGLHIDHLCRNRACVNPAHLETVTQAENNRRGLGNGYREKTHCKWGHEFTEENTAYIASGRRCRECGRRRSREHKQRVRAAT